MTSIFGSYFYEDYQSISKPLYFNGVNYSYWKTRMMLLMILQFDKSSWRAIKNEVKKIKGIYNLMLRQCTFYFVHLVWKSTIGCHLVSMPRRYEASLRSLMKNKKKPIFAL
ncbi:hypothetical protein EPI10_031333 [Gossypium australe]|uniref:DUF4219 domain-containing protein n=1 Tax=Gossypium australe TaxID=47621 RepID=A0A5B6X2I4_9ROSI|nr:hypothetical protein EPI10_031333 [Gossypium australe]